MAYYLMFDNQMRMKSGAYLREELSEASDAMMQHPSGAAAAAGPCWAPANSDTNRLQRRDATNSESVLRWVLLTF